MINIFELMDREIAIAVAIHMGLLIAAYFIGVMWGRLSKGEEEERDKWNKRRKCNDCE